MHAVHVRVPRVFYVNSRVPQGAEVCVYVYVCMYVCSVWVIIGGAMHAVNVRVPRVFYVNSRVPQGGRGVCVCVCVCVCASTHLITYTRTLTESHIHTHLITINNRQVGRSVSRILPGGHSCLQLYEVTMEEEQFRAMSRVCVCERERERERERVCVCVCERESGRV